MRGEGRFARGEGVGIRGEGRFAWGEAVFAANVVLLKNGKLAAGAETDLDGNYSIAGVDPGDYDVRCSFLGMSDNLIQGFTARNGKINRLDIKMENSGVTLGTAIITTYRNKLIDSDNTSAGKALTGKEVAAMPTKNFTKTF